MWHVDDLGPFFILQLFSLNKKWTFYFSLKKIFDLESKSSTLKSSNYELIILQKKFSVVCSNMFLEIHILIQKPYLLDSYHNRKSYFPMVLCNTQCS